MKPAYKDAPVLAMLDVHSLHSGCYCGANPAKITQGPRAGMGNFFVNRESFMASYGFEKFIEMNDGA